MVYFTLFKLGRITNQWIRDGLSEVLSTFILALFIYASGAQSVLTNGEASSVPARALAAGSGLAFAVFCGFNASGACVNPCIALMFCLTGKLKWRRYLWYVLCEFTGAYIAAALTYGVYIELIDQFEGGTRSVVGENATAHIFTSFPRDGISKRAGFFDVFVGSGLLTSITCMIIDPNNAGASNGVIPLALIFLVYGIVMCFGIQTGAPINLSVDFSGRLLAYTVGYGNEVFSHANYWFWVPPVACVSGCLCFVTTYQLMIGNHLVRNGTAEDSIEDNSSSSGSTKTGRSTSVWSSSQSVQSISKSELKKDGLCTPTNFNHISYRL